MRSVFIERELKTMKLTREKTSEVMDVLFDFDDSDGFLDMSDKYSDFQKQLKINGDLMYVVCDGIDANNVHTEMVEVAVCKSNFEHGNNGIHEWKAS